MKKPFAGTLNLRRNRTKDAIKGGILLTGMILAIFTLLAVSLAPSAADFQNKKFTCYESIDGIQCRLM